MFRFTFQYGSIQIDLEVSGSMKIPDLHSNMVLFKSNWLAKEREWIKIYIPIWFYSNSFQVIFYFIYVNLHSNMVLFKSEIQLVWVKTQSFTFQYGSIQITYEEYMFVDNKIYIPIWFYSNSFRQKEIKMLISFTFQYGSIQMKKT